MRQKLNRVRKQQQPGKVRGRGQNWKYFECKGILILFSKLQVGIGGVLFFSDVFCFSKKGNTISLCFAEVNLARASHKCV